MQKRANQISGIKINTKRRENSLDIIRGIAVILMMLAHTIFFFHNGSNIFLKSVQDVGDTLAFVTFLVVSGATTYYVYQRKKDDWAKEKDKSFKRLLFLLLGYFVVAIVSNFQNFDFSSPYWITQLVEIITFINTPGFTEFLVNFIVYGSIFILIPDFFDYLGKNIRVSVGLGILLYVIGVLIYPIDLPAPFLEYKMLLSGHEDIYRFPLLQYAPVYLIGLNIGHLLRESINVVEKRKKIFKSALPFILIVSFVLLLNNFGGTLNIEHLTDFERWPPSVPFLSVGILFSLILFFLIIRSSNKDKIPFYYEIFISFGKNAYYYFIFHLIFLQIYDKLGGIRHESPLFYFPSAFVLFFITTFTVKKYTESNKKKRLKKEDETDPYEKKKKKAPHLSIFIILIYSAIFSAGFNLDSSISRIAGYPKRTGDIKGVVFSKREIEVKWWNYDFQYSKRLTVINDGLFAPIPKDTVVEFSIDYFEMFVDNKILPDASDIRLVYSNDGEFTEIPHFLDINNDKALVRFSTVDEIGPGERNGDYYMYYGNRAASKPLPNEQLINANIELGRIALSNERISSLSISVNRVWTLIGESSGDSLKVDLEINQDPFPQNQNVEYTYEVVGTDVRGRIFRSPNTGYSVDIDVNQFKPGIYQVQAVAQSNGERIPSSKETFIVSYPLYLSWTMDWEGYDVKDQFLNDMDQLANEYNVPISHFFNPRIYIASNISAERADKLTNWVKDGRDQRGDSIDMHFHMFEDMVSRAGVDPKFINGDEDKPRPQWGSIQQYGYDVLMTSFDREELNKILNWGLNKFEEEGLPEPLGFRAGGWFADLENLQSIEESGFEFDSSGREEYSWGSKKASGPWSLTPTTQPYRPSKQNQNSSNPAPNFDLWEIPNNGSDSYTFSSSDMISRFDQNYNGDFLREKRAVTYLSHPHWFNIDKEKLEELFEYASKYDFNEDKGPVVFTNIHNVYEAWAE